jgi:hypothetical protein
MISGRPFFPQYSNKACAQWVLCAGAPTQLLSELWWWPGQVGSCDAAGFPEPWWVGRQCRNWVVTRSKHLTVWKTSNSFSSIWLSGWMSAAGKGRIICTFQHNHSAKSGPTLLYVLSALKYSLRHRIKDHLAFKICPTIKKIISLLNKYELYFYLSPSLLLIFCALSISLISLILVPNTQATILSKTGGVLTNTSCFKDTECVRDLQCSAPSQNAARANHAAAGWLQTAFTGRVSFSFHCE